MGEDIIAVVEVTDVFWAIIRFNFTLVQLSIVEEVCLFCLFVYFHQLSVTMNNNKINGNNRNKTTKRNSKKKLQPLMMMEPKCTVAWLIACWPHESRQSTVKVMSH